MNKHYYIIDSDNYKAAGIETFFFPGGEPHAKIPNLLMGDYLLVLKLRTWEDVGRAICVLDAIWQQQEQTEPPFRTNVKVFIPYFPGARQDRSDGRTPVTRDLMEMMLGYGDGMIHVFDIHSFRDSDRFSMRNWMPSDLNLRTYIDPDHYVGIIAPDEGAVARARDFASALDPHMPVIVATKTRDFATGRITGYELPQAVFDAERYLVVDDICDGGATFNLLVDAVPKECKLDLWVSHGIFSKGVAALSARYETIFTTDSWWHKSRGMGDDWFCDWPRVQPVSLIPLYDRIMES